MSSMHMTPSERTFSGAWRQFVKLRNVCCMSCVSAPTTRWPLFQFTVWLGEGGKFTTYGHVRSTSAFVRNFSTYILVCCSCRTDTRTFCDARGDRAAHKITNPSPKRQRYHPRPPLIFRRLILHPRLIFCQLILCITICIIGFDFYEFVVKIKSTTVSFELFNKFFDVCERSR